MTQGKANILGIIPARYGSTRFPGKPLAKILNKTLIQRTYENALRCPLLEDLVVATDDQRVFDHVVEFGGKVVMTSKDCFTGSDRLVEVLKKYPNYQKANIIVNIQGDEPCLSLVMIEKAVKALIDDESAHMSTAVVPLKETELDSNHVKCVFGTDGNALYFSRSLIPGNQTGKYNPKNTYYKHIGFYVYRKDFLLKYGSLSPTPLQVIEDLEQLKVLEHGYKIKVVTVDSISLDINTPEDIQKVEQELCRQNIYL